MFSGAQEAMANPTSQAADPQGGGIDLDAVARDIASLPETDLLEFGESLESYLQERDLSLEMLAGAGKQLRRQRDAEMEDDEEDEGEMAAAGPIGRVEYR